MHNAPTELLSTCTGPQDWARNQPRIPRRDGLRDARRVRLAPRLEFLRRQVTESGVNPLPRVDVRQKLADATVGIVFVQRRLLCP